MLRRVNRARRKRRARFVFGGYLSYPRFLANVQNGLNTFAARGASLLFSFTILFTV
mgnify:CR=1 FL=1